MADRGESKLEIDDGFKGECADRIAFLLAEITDALKNTGPIASYDEDGHVDNGFVKDQVNQMLSPAHERKLKLRMDLRIMSSLSILYLLAFLDR